MKISLDKLVAILAALAVAILPVLTTDGVLTSRLAADLGAAIATFILGYHIPNGLNLPRSLPEAVSDVVAAAVLPTPEPDPVPVVVAPAPVVAPLPTVGEDTTVPTSQVPQI